MSKIRSLLSPARAQAAVLPGAGEMFWNRAFSTRNSGCIASATAAQFSRNSGRIGRGIAATRYVNSEQPKTEAAWITEHKDALTWPKICPFPFQYTGREPIPSNLMRVLIAYRCLSSCWISHSPSAARFGAGFIQVIVLYELLCSHVTKLLCASPGSVHVVQDSRTKKHNFDPYLQHIVQPSEFDYSAAFPYVPPSADSVC